LHHTPWRQLKQLRPNYGTLLDRLIRGIRVSVNDEILELFADRGSCAYYGETVSTTEHALQAAHFARQDGASPALILAALLHDIGHLLEEVANDISQWTADARHEQVGGNWLAQRFRPDVSEPVRLHVPAKRYLCATDADYLAMLSPASLITLKFQGGPMSAGERTSFEAEPFHRDAIRIRRWDDRGKIAGLATPGLPDYRDLIDSLTLA
jgi:[1-hydroxy-2-(trimethylamino)ethyl]phosphonate dioxygenase